jgi:predicted ATPase/DNA-binding SARP family transcriptional activator/DNA-binding CsgD family transcriptional regulator
MSDGGQVSGAGVLEAVRIRLLGDFRVSVGARAIEPGQWRLRKAASLVKLLALTPGHRLHREQVADLMWPESGRKAVSNNLRQALHAARRALDPGPASPNRYLRLRDGQLALCPKANLWVDVEMFEEAAAAARRSRDPALFKAAIELYAGDLLPEDRYEEWTEERRSGLRATFLSLLLGLADLHEDRTEYAPAIEALQRAVAKEATLEEAHAGLMRLYALSGQRAQALAQYERLRETLFKELSTEPGAETGRLRDEIALGTLSPSRSPAGRVSKASSDDRRHNLPAPRISFVGREREMLEVKRQLAMTRLLTLTGTGGSGKTRLALEVARGLVGTYADGVWLVELAPLSVGELVPEVVAGVLGVPERPGEPLGETLVESLRDKSLLLVVDNCEHLVEATASLVDLLLDSCPHLRVMATSREGLGVTGEVRWAVPPLTVPDARRSLTATEVEGYESARLFVERARHREPRFVLGPGNAATVAEICWRLEGVPLAIELAAARVDVLSVEQISERLEDPLGLLTGGDRTSVPRQRTLKWTLDWSHELLGEGERLLFRRLSVFAGGWTLEAAEAVTAGEGVEEEDVLDLLSGLSDKSLVVAEATGTARYRLLEPVRQYALAKLEESGEAEAVRRRHAQYFTALAEEIEPRYRGPEEAGGLDLVETEHDNMRVALSWTIRREEAVLGLRLAGALRWFWSLRGYLSEGARHLEEALAGGAAASVAERAGALFGLGLIVKGQGELERAQARFEEALALYEELGDRGCVADSLAFLGWAVYYQDDIARASRLFEESLKVARESGNRTVIPNVLVDLAWIAYDGGDFGRSRKLWGEALALNRELGNVSGILVVIQNMGYAELALGNHEQATKLLKESLAIAQKVGNKRYVAACHLSLGVAATLRGDPEWANALIREALVTFLELENRGDIAESLESLAGAVGLLGENVRAARLWGAAAALREATGWHWWAAERRLLEPQLIAARSRMGETEWEAAFAEGKAMDLQEAAEYALRESELAPEAPPAAVPSPAHESPATLTRRESEVAALVARGMTNRQIASQLSISEHTAATHVAKILRKLGLRSRSQLAAWMSDRGSHNSSPV